MKLGICIPYRNRKTHLKKLIKTLGKYLNFKKIDHKFYIAHQTDKKLFNRGAMKNIAAKHAFEDGCDYIAWHDVDMIPADDTPDYSYPKDYPIHIATNLSKFNNGMRYEQYFGGVVLFTKEQVEKVNGYSNEYWDWGQEDDDLFWRCYYENLVSIQEIAKYEKTKVAYFNGKNSYLSIKSDKELNSTLNNSYTISLLVKPQHNKKYPEYLIGDETKKFIEYPIIRKSEVDNWGVSFNNSNAISFMCKDIKNNYYYNWGKRKDEMWTWVTVSFQRETNSFYFFINDELIFMEEEEKKNTGFKLKSKIKFFHKNDNIFIGFDQNSKIFFKGSVASIKIYDNVVFELKKDLPKYYWDVNSKSFANLDIKSSNIKIKKDNINVIKSILPYRKHGKFICMNHKDEGFLNGEWIKKDTTSKNEKKLSERLKLKKFPYKNDGINNLKYNIISIEKIKENAEMINVTL